MPDCASPKCHEAMTVKIKDKVSWSDFDKLKTCVREKVPKKTVWKLFSILVPLILILGGIGINVWSEQKGADNKYAQNEDMVKVQVIVEHLVNGVAELKQDIKEGQTKAQTDREEMLRLLRKR